MKTKRLYFALMVLVITLGGCTRFNPFYRSKTAGYICISAFILAVVFGTVTIVSGVKSERGQIAGAFAAVGLIVSLIVLA